MNFVNVASLCIVAVLLLLSAALGVNQRKTTEVFVMPENHLRGHVHSDGSARPSEQNELDPPQNDSNAETHYVAAERSLHVLIVDPQLIAPRRSD